MEERMKALEERMAALEAKFESDLTINQLVSEIERIATLKFRKENYHAFK